MEYSITEDELREIIEMLGNGWYCETVEADETKDYELIRC